MPIRPHDDPFFSHYAAYRLLGRPLRLLDELEAIRLYTQMKDAIAQRRPESLPNLSQVPRWALVTVLLVPNCQRAYEHDEKLTTHLDRLIADLERLNTR